MNVKTDSWEYFIAVNAAGEQLFVDRELGDLLLRIEHSSEQDSAHFPLGTISVKRVKCVQTSEPCDLLTSEDVLQLIGTIQSVRTRE